MDFNLTNEQKKIQQMARDFTQEYVAPIAAEIDADARFPKDTIENAGKKGFMGLPFPRKWGGYGSDYVSYVMSIEEISKFCASTGVIIQTHCAVCAWPIMTFGTEIQKKKYLPDLLAGRKLGAFGMTEPNAGSDVVGIETTAVDMGDCYIINGNKIFISGGGVADVYVIMAMTDKGKRAKGISAFILEKGMKGFTCPNRTNKMGIRAAIATELVFTDVKVPKENILGGLGEGFKIAMKSLDVGRLGIAAQAIGIAQGAFDETVRYGKL